MNVYGGFGFLKQLGDADAQDIFFRAADVIGAKSMQVFGIMPVVWY